MSLVLRDISITLGTKVLVVPFSLAIGKGEILTLMGPSGSGKSSVLSALAGTLVAPLAVHGAATLDGRDIFGLPAEQRRMGRLFQDDLLFPHMTVGENLLFGMARGQREDRLSAMRAALKEIELEGFEDRPPQTLSGGQRQRISLMRSLLARPAAMLLDEPFSKLDQTLRAQIRRNTFGLLMARGTPTLLVTHDIADAPEAGRVLLITPHGEVKDV